jgi:hypothetical protein
MGFLPNERYFGTLHCSSVIMHRYDVVNKRLLGLALGSLTLLTCCLALQRGAGYNSQVVMMLAPFGVASLLAAIAALIGSLRMLFVQGWYANSKGRFYTTVAFALAAVLVFSFQFALQELLT